MKRFRLAAVLTAAAVCCSVTAQFSVMADTSPEDVLMVCDFENGAELPIVSSSGASAEVVSSPVGSSYEVIGSYSENTAENVEAGLKVFEDLKQSDLNNNVLKLSAAGNNDSNTMVIYKGKLPSNFALDFSVLGSPSLADFDISVKQGDSAYKLIRYERWGSVYITDGSGQNGRVGVVSTDVWLPNTLIFDNFASDNTMLTMYQNGRLNYTPSATNPQGYTNANLDLGNYYKDIDLSQEIEIVLTQTKGTQSIYFDSFRLYKHNNKISNEAGSTFETETERMLPMQNGIRTGGYISRQWFYTSTEDKTQKQNYGLLSYSTTVERDPYNSSNKVLKSIRGSRSDERSFDSSVRYTVNKPKEKLEISFKALTNGTFNIACDIADGTFNDLFFGLNANTPADRIFALEGANGQFISSGRYNGYFAPAVKWETDKWNDVKLVYDIKDNKTSFNINGVEFNVIPNPNSERISKIMASDEEDTVTLNIFRPYPVTNEYIMLDDISIISDDGNPKPTPTPEPTPEPTPAPAVSVTEAQPLEKTDAPGEKVGLFWNVTLSDLSKGEVKGTFTDGEKTMERTFDLSNITGDGSAVFSVMMLGAPDNLTAEFE